MHGGRGERAKVIGLTSCEHCEEESIHMYSIDWKPLHQYVRLSPVNLVGLMWGKATSRRKGVNALGSLLQIVKTLFPAVLLHG